MKTKAEFERAMVDAISAYPAASLYYQVRDPRLLAALSANAAMLAMLSTEQDVASMEPYTKARDMTVLADAAVKGVLPFGSPTVARIKIENAGAGAVQVTAGRRLRDTQGRIWTVTVGGTAPPAGSALIEAEQVSLSSFDHVVGAPRGFYRIDVPQPENGHIVSVRLAGATAGAFEYVAGFVNVSPGDKVFHLATDEKRRLYIQFGSSDSVGYQPAGGESFTVTTSETEGAITLSATSLFTFQYSASVYESAAKMSLVEVLSPGADPMDIATMREVCSYPSTYDNNAVYLGNYDFLVRRNLSPFKFLSIWNEQREEEVRGPNQDNINALFIAARKTGVEAATLQTQIRRIIEGADDALRLKFVEIIDIEIVVKITIFAQSVYDFAAVKQDAIDLVLANYGEDSAWAKRGEAVIRYKDLYDALTNDIQALGDRNSDLRVEVVNVDVAPNPEQFRRVTASSLTVNVVEAS